MLEKNRQTREIKSFKNNSELKLSIWGRAASRGKLVDAGLPISSLCRDGK